MKNNTSTVIFVLSFFTVLGVWICISLMLMPSPTQPESVAPHWYCIEGKLYEKFGDTYASIVPPRTCLPVNKE